MALKKILVILAMLILSTFFPKEMFAARNNLPDGLLVGDDQGIKVSTDGGYFFNLDNLQPGDVVKRKLIIKNRRSESYLLKLIMKTKSQTGAFNLVENISIQIQIDEQEIYQGSLDSAKEEISFGTIPAHSDKTAVISLTVNDKVDNWPQLYYSGTSEAVVDWSFTAIQPYEKDQSTSTIVRQVIPPSVRRFLPQTGTALSCWIIAVGILLIVVTGVIFVKRRNK